jgi:hypothetical protein
MNIQPTSAQTDTTSASRTAVKATDAASTNAGLPAGAEEPIRSDFLDEERLRALG